MGVVYEAFDRERKSAVALKTMQRFDPTALYRFKQEFRTLADVHHPNLVRLHELVVNEKDPVFFVMELIRGTDFLAHVRRRAARDATNALSGPELYELRAALRQLAEGAHALHAARKLHRDIKPSNVLVTGESRVVLLDFGVATEVASPIDEGALSESEQVGTAAYMAPEQALEELPTPASDWYSVGVMLYEALVGSPPFVGSRYAVVTEKLTVDAPPPSARARGVPEDLDALCSTLLQRDPTKRLTGPEILRVLGANHSAVSNGSPSTLGVTQTPALIGREQELRALRGAFDQTLSGRSLSVRVGGASGMGKSAIAHRFLDELVEEREAVVLRGRAYERESVPYKAFDSVVDALSRHLMYLDERGESLELPDDIGPLAHVFPVLRRVPGIGSAEDETIVDPQNVRMRAFAALRELLASLARRHPLVVYIDDVQWGDTDSAALLLEVMRPPNASRLLLLMTYRDEGAATSPFLLAINERWPLAAEMRDLTVGPLRVEDAQRLALSLMDSSDELAQRIARAVARESKGAPFLVEELVRSSRSESVDGAKTLPVYTLGQIVGERLARLSEEERRLAEIVAVGGRPLALSTLIDACGEPVGLAEQIDRLRSERLVRVGFCDGHEVLEPSHDRIRETIVEQLPRSVLRDCHARLAHALEQTDGADLEAIAVHLLGSGDTSTGARYAERAAEQAASKLAFDQAARLYRLALDTIPRTADEARSLRKRLAVALDQAGRGGEAAEAYLEAAKGAPMLERVALERSAAEQLLGSGHVDEGAKVLRRVLEAVGMKAPRTPIGAIVSVLMHRLLLHIQGLRFTERAPDQVSPEDRLRLDALYAAALGFSVVDVALGACMQARFLRLALRVGDRSHVLHATSLALSDRAHQGGKVSQFERSAAAIAERMAQAIGGSYAEWYFQTCRGIALFLRGFWQEAREVLHRYPARAVTDSVVANGNRLFGVYVLFYLGRVREEGLRAARVLADAERRGDLHAMVNLRSTALVDVTLAADDPEAAREHIQFAEARSTPSGFLIQHWQAMVWGAEIELYTGHGERAYARLESNRRAYARSLLDGSQFIRELTRFALGRSAVASALEAPIELRRARLAEARKTARRLERAAMPWTAPLASLVLAAASNAEGETNAAVAALRAAIARAEAADMMLHASAARHRLAGMLGGDEGDRLRRQAEEEMAAAGVRAPARFANMLLPGRWGAQ
jgi:hypothetical protein